MQYNIDTEAQYQHQEHIPICKTRKTARHTGYQCISTYHIAPAILYFDLDFYILTRTNYYYLYTTRYYL